MPITVFLLLAAFPSFSPAASEHIEHLWTLEIPGNTRDRSELDGELESGLRHDLFGGISAIEYTGHDNLFLALSDRGPKDGAVDWNCRVHLIRIEPRISKTGQPDFSVVKTILLRDGQRFFSGLASRFDSQTSINRLDPEAIRMGNEGRFFIADEYGPHLLEFSADGGLLRRLPVPSRYSIQNPGLTKQDENEQNRTGRQGNRGMEGLAISADHSHLFGLMQSPLLQDCSRSKKGKPSGLHCRLLELEPESGISHEFVYQLESPDNKLNEILAVDDRRFLVIERDGEAGTDAKFKKIMLIDIEGATDTGSSDSLPAKVLPPNVEPVHKEVLIDLLDLRYGISGKSMPEKIEGLAFGESLDDGRRTLLIASDNDFDTGQPTYIYCFAIGDSTEVSTTDLINNHKKGQK